MRSRSLHFINIQAAYILKGLDFLKMLQLFIAHTGTYHLIYISTKLSEQITASFFVVLCIRGREFLRRFGTRLSKYTASHHILCMSVKIHGVATHLVHVCQNTRRHNTEHPRLQSVICPQVFVSIAITLLAPELFFFNFSTLCI